MRGSGRISKGDRVEMRVLVDNLTRKQLDKHYSNMHPKNRYETAGDRVVQVA